MSHRALRLTGNLLIILSIIGFLVLMSPLLMTYLPSSRPLLPAEPSKSFRIAIPKIQAHSPVIPNVDPWDERTYREALRRGVAHAKTTGLPGEGRTVYLFAHSTGLPWDQLYYNTIFLRLGELSVGDEVYLDLNKKRYTYKVVNKKEVQPNEINYLQNTAKDQLILQTCTPIGTSLRRLLIFAEPQ